MAEGGFPGRPGGTGFPPSALLRLSRGSQGHLDCVGSGNQRVKVGAQQGPSVGLECH